MDIISIFSDLATTESAYGLFVVGLVLIFARGGDAPDIPAAIRPKPIPVDTLEHAEADAILPFPMEQE